MRKYVLRAICLISILVIFPSHIFAADDGLVLHFVDAGGGDSIFIRLPDGKSILLDAGSPDAGPGLVEYLRSIGAKRIDHFIFTHPHDDHIGGLFSVLSEFEVGKFYDNGSDNFRSDIYEDYLMAVRKDFSSYRVLRAGESLSFGKVEIEVINPQTPLNRRPNDNSIVLRLRYGAINMLFTGDMGAAGEKRLLNIGTELKSHILKVGHHGHSDASSKEFLAAVSPQVALITVSADNKYALPRQEALNRLKAAGIKIYRTDQDGHVVLKTDGKVFSVKTEKPLKGDRK